MFVEYFFSHEIQYIPRGMLDGMTKAKRYVITFVIFDLIIIAALLFYMDRADAPEPTENQQTSTEQPADPQPNIATFDKARFSLDDPTSIWVIVNKTRPIDLGFAPGDLVTPDVALNSAKSAEENMLRKEVGVALKPLLDAAKAEGHDLFLASGYRSSQLQKTYYDGYVARDGQAAADLYSARPGTSEHQTGLSFDLASADRSCYLEICFGASPAGKWLAANAHTYGFVVRYPEGKESITGYQYEPWHFRYVGKDLAGELAKSNETLETFFAVN